MTESVVVYQPEGRRIKVQQGENLFEAAKKHGIGIASSCGGRGLCGKCKVIVLEGTECLAGETNSDHIFLSKEGMAKGYRLSCRCVLTTPGNIVVEIPPESYVGKQRLQTSGTEAPVELSPVVRKLVVKLRKPTLDDVEPDLERFLGALKDSLDKNIRVSYEVMKSLPDVAREGNWTVTAVVWRDSEIIAVEPGDTSSRLFGFAIDIGSTKLAGYLLDLNTGDIVATTSKANPQIPFGEDIISRIAYTMKDRASVNELQRTVAEGINELISKACLEGRIRHDEIYDMTVAGNTAMHHMFLNINPKYVALSPYPAAVKAPLDIRSKDLSITINQGAYTHMLPIVAGWVGGDAVADVLATELHTLKECALVIDIGTNVEVSLSDRKRLVSASSPSGPAFEGARITFGMRAISGAVERVWIDPVSLDLQYQTVDDEKPKGICGSGIIDAIAEMLKAGIIDTTGKILSNPNNQRVRASEKGNEFVLVWKEKSATGQDIVITQRDIGEIQLAKAACYTGGYMVMRSANVQPADLERIYIAGAFGNYVDPESARTIGMYPDVPIERVKFVGNTAGAGARMALRSVKIRETARYISETMEHLQLATDPTFQHEFVNAMFLPNKILDRFPSVMKLFEIRKGA